MRLGDSTHDSVLLKPRGRRVCLLAIRPHPAELILSGRKSAEFRRIPPRLPPPFWAAFYVSDTIRAIRFLCTVREVVVGTPQTVIQNTWELNEAGSHDLDRVAAYLTGARSPGALVLEEIVEVPAISLRELRDLDAAFTPPQNFTYIDEVSPVFAKLRPYLPRLEPVVHRQAELWDHPSAT